MPGILPMKVIKVGANAQSRIAQACDRCRSKKIRCDGVRPCCSQCANVGFECKTSDKLSRRAFPRGYTESLEERVRVLEAEVRELKELLDAKDEKIDVLSRIHSQSSHPIHLPSPRRQSTASFDASIDGRASPPKDDLFNVQQSPFLLDDEEGADSYFAGTSSGRSFVESFKHRVEEAGRSITDVDVGRLLSSSRQKSSETGVKTPQSLTIYKAPPRLVSDQLVNVFFQEWAPLFPVLHRPTFLALYERFTTDLESVTEKVEIAQLNLVFGIAALSSGTRCSADLESFESQWKAAMDAIITDNSMATLQALLLAQLFCVQQGDATRLQTYKGLSMSLSAHLGLHQSQKRFALGALMCETRKKVFWTLYTVDSFTAVILGLPKQLKDDDVQCEYPVDVDDEYVTEQGFQPTLPGESTKLSSALALFRASRMLSKVLTEAFPAKASYNLSLKKITDLSDELDSWYNGLAPHLRLQFTQDKPSTGTISSRSPLLSLTYHFIRALIHRPPICASIGARSQSSMMATASSCKHMIQIVQLLEERGLSFSFCLNSDEVLVLAGLGLLFQALDLDDRSKILKDNSKMIWNAVNVLKKSDAPCGLALELVAASIVSLKHPNSEAEKTEEPSLSRHNSEDSRSTRSLSQESSTKKQLKAIASRLTNSTKTLRPELTNNNQSTTHEDFESLLYSPETQDGASSQPLDYDPPSISRSEPARSPNNIGSRSASLTTNRQSMPVSQAKARARPALQKRPNLDYLSFGSEPESQTPPAGQASQPIKTEPQPTDWEKLLGSLDNGESNIFDACYGGQPIGGLLGTPALTLSSTLSADNPNAMSWSAGLWALQHANTQNPSTSASRPSGVQQAGSIFSFATDEGLSSSEDLTADWASSSSTNSQKGYGEILLPHADDLLYEARTWG